MSKTRLNEVASYPDLPAYTQTFTHDFFLPGRSGRFGDVMVMSHGCDLNIHGHGLNFLDMYRSLPTLGTQSAFSSFARARSLTSIRSRYQRLVRSSQVWKLESRTGDDGLKTRVNWCIQDWPDRTSRNHDSSGSTWLVMHNIMA